NRFATSEPGCSSVRHAVGRKCSGRVQGLARGLGGTRETRQTDLSTSSPTIQSSDSAINQRSLHVLAYNLTRVMNIMGAQPRGSVRKGAVGSKQKPRKSTRCYVRAKRRVELRPRRMCRHLSSIIIARK